MSAKEASVLVWHGSDEYTAQQQARQAVDRLCPPPNQAFGLEVIDGRGIETKEAVFQTLRQCTESLLTVGFFGAGKVVWLRDAVFLSTSGKGLADEARDELDRLVALLKKGLADGVHLVINAPKLDKRSVFYKTCEAVGEVVACALPEKDWQIQSFSRDRILEVFREAGFSMDPAAMDMFLDRVGADQRQIHMEAEKLMLYKGKPGRVTAADVQLMVARTRADAGYELSDALGRQELPRALRLLHQIELQGDSAMGLIMGLERHFSQLLVLRDLLDRKWLRIVQKGPKYSDAEWDAQPEVAAMRDGLDPKLTGMHPYALKLKCEQAQLFSLRQLGNLMTLIVKTHEKMVSSSQISPYQQIELLVLEMFSQMRPHPRPRGA